MPGYHSVKKMDSVFGKHCFKKEGGLENRVFDYTMSKRELKKKYKSDKETKDLVETSNFRTKMKAIASQVASYGSFAKGLKSGLTGLVKSKLPSKAEFEKLEHGSRKALGNIQAQAMSSIFKKSGKVAPALLKRCGTKNK